MVSSLHYISFHNGLTVKFFVKAKCYHSNSQRQITILFYHILMTYATPQKRLWVAFFIVPL